MSDLEAEREIDLSRWRQAAAERWWIVLAGLLAGAVAGALLAVSGGSVYRASVLLAPGTPFTANGTPVQSWATSQRVIHELVTSEAGLKRAARAAGIGVGPLRGNVNTETVQTGVGATAARSAVLVRVTVRLGRPRRAEQAANALAVVAVEGTTTDYVRKSIETYESKLRGYEQRLNSLSRRIDQLSRALATQTQLEPLQQLVLVSQLDFAEQRSESLRESQAETEQQRDLARDVMITQIIEDAVAVKTTARSPRNSILVGALLGFILGLVAALVVDWRAARARPS